MPLLHLHAHDGLTQRTALAEKNQERNWEDANVRSVWRMGVYAAPDMNCLCADHDDASGVWI